MLILVASLLSAGGCGQTEQASQQSNPSAEETADSIAPTQDILYENSDVGIKVYQLPGWEVGKEGKSDTFNVTFHRDNLKAIITLVSSDLSLEEIKQTLVTGAGPVEIIEETDTYLALQSKRKEPVRTDIYIEQLEEQTVIYTFMTPAEAYTENQPYMESLKQNVAVN
ncbi:hypothetical protein HUR95_00520 [Caldalkalibacillus thermarum TA2.A1]|uniref:Uncharacterized protein n=1 Tax=Caldalkalibacillus thermarum (strain TA2.A1) TaxID=986075 RepID=A0A8X8I3Y4_CALTT|nr:hypothetical protein [Caldalkalibacillus thermarum]QZT33960.1 hypothetical protein HUR95_00520 [Caldalkalibacillus thermarum TA2.A1]